MGVICRESVTGVNVLEILVISGWETGGKNNQSPKSVLKFDIKV